MVEVPVDACFWRNAVVCWERLRASELDCLSRELSDMTIQSSGLFIKQVDETGSMIARTLAKIPKAAGSRRLTLAQGPGRSMSLPVPPKHYNFHQA